MKKTEKPKIKINPADKVEHWPIEKLIPYARNSRTHSAEQIAQIAASIREWGFTTAILVDESGQIIAGHGRVMAARQLDMSELPVMVASGWTESQKRAYVIADNKLALNAGWDEEMLRLELDELAALDFDVELTGFSVDEIAKLDLDDESEKAAKIDDKQDFFVLIPCGDEITQQQVFEEMNSRGFVCKLMN